MNLYFVFNTTDELKSKVSQLQNFRSHLDLQLSYRFGLHPISFRIFKYSLMWINVRPCNTFSDIQMALNQKFYQLVQTDFVELYKFDRNFIFVQLYMKSLIKEHTYELCHHRCWSHKCQLLLRTSTYVMPICVIALIDAGLL